jgi:hypothetical protein
MSTAPFTWLRRTIRTFEPPGFEVVASFACASTADDASSESEERVMALKRRVDLMFASSFSLANVLKTPLDEGIAQGAPWQ